MDTTVRPACPDVAHPKGRERDSLANRPTANVAFLVERAGAVKDRGGGRIDIRRILSPPGLLRGRRLGGVRLRLSCRRRSASADQTLNSGDYPNGFEVPAGETWTFNPNADTSITSGGNVIVRGTLVMKPANGNVEHVLRFTGVNESAFRRRRHGPGRHDVGLWVVGSGRIIEGEEKVAWDRQYHSSWAGDEVIAAPHTPGTTTGSGGSLRLLPPTPSATGPSLLNLTRNVRIEGTPQGYTHVFIRSSPIDHPLCHVALRRTGPEFLHARNGLDRTVRHTHPHGRQWEPRHPRRG